MKQIIKKWITCQRNQANNLDPKMSDLPFQRPEAMKTPFCTTRIDLFGPIHVKK